MFEFEIENYVAVAQLPFTFEKLDIVDAKLTVNANTQIFNQFTLPQGNFHFPLRLVASITLFLFVDASDQLFTSKVGTILTIHKLPLKR